MNLQLLAPVQCRKKNSEETTILLTTPADKSGTPFIAQITTTLAFTVTLFLSQVMYSCTPPPKKAATDATLPKEVEVTLNTPIREYFNHTKPVTAVPMKVAKSTEQSPTSIAPTEFFTPQIKDTPTAQRAPVNRTTVTAPIAATQIVTPMITHTTGTRHPVDTVAVYWKLVNNQDYKPAWSMLSEGFRERKHNNNYADYQSTYQEMGLCGVEAIDIQTIEEHNLSAMVSAHISYLTGGSCDNQREFLFNFRLARETPVSAWEIDIVTPEDNRDILLNATAKCEDNMAAVIPSSLNVRAGPGAGRDNEALYPIKSYLQKNECVIAISTNSDSSWVQLSGTPRKGAEDGWVAVSFLQFGHAHPELALLPKVTEQTPLPTDPPPKDEWLQPIGIEHLGSAEYVCYDIQGTSGQELALQMDALGPYDSDGNKTWAVASLQVVISGGTCYSDVSVDLSDVTVLLNSTITMPCWYPPPGSSPAEISKFDNLMQLIAIHELRHVEIAWEWAGILEEQLRNANTCAQEKLNEIYSQVWADAEAAQDAYHASPEGKIVPFP